MTEINQLYDLNQIVDEDWRIFFNKNMVPWGIICKNAEKVHQTLKMTKIDPKNEQNRILCDERFFLFKNMGFWDVICKKGKKGPSDPNYPKKWPKSTNSDFTWGLQAFLLLKNIGFWGEICQKVKKSSVRQKIPKNDQNRPKKIEL